MPTREQLLEIYVFLARAVERHWHKGAVAFGITAVVALAGTAVAEDALTDS